MKKLLGFNKQAYTAELNALEGGQKSKLQAVINAYNATGLPPLETDDLPKLLSDTDELVIDKLTKGEPLLLAGMPVKRNKVFEMIEKPEGLDILKQLISSSFGTTWFPLDMFEISEGKLEINPVKKAELEERYKFYATTQKQVDVLAEIETIAGALNKLNSLGVDFAGFNPEAAVKFIGKAIIAKNDDSGKEFIIDPKFIYNGF